jgi:RNA polymerase sigma-70 factor (ECF subfamily)
MPTPQNISYHENEVLALLAQGSEAAFRQLYERHWPGIYKVAYKYLHSTELAEDIVQEIFSKLWQKRTEFTEVQHLQFYLVTMTRNMAYKHLKKLATEAVANKEFALKESPVRNEGETAVLDKQYEALLEQAVSLLPPQRKHIFQLAKRDGLSHEAIAERLHISPNTVKNQMVAALQFIRHRLEHHITSVLVLAFLGELFH